MICPMCKEQGLKSHVFVIDNITDDNTNNILRYYDEEGRWHNHVDVIYTTKYRCHNYHYFQKIEIPKCWCMEQVETVITTFQP